MFRRIAFIGIAAAIALAVGAPGPVRAEITDKRYNEMRDEMKSLYIVQSLLSWFERTQGERSVFQDSYAGHEDLFTKESIAHIDKLLKTKGLSADDARAMNYMKNALVIEYISLDTAHFSDEINNAESAAVVTLEGETEKIPYRQISVLMAKEEDPERRKKFQNAQAKVWKDILNPIHEKEEARVQQLARELGYSDYVALSQGFRGVDLKALIAKTAVFYKQTDAKYRELLEKEVDAALHIPVSKLSRADIAILASVPHLKQFFPEELAIPSFTYFLEGMGLDLTTASGSKIKVDDEKREKKEPRAACYSITVPDDVRITVKPSGGVSDAETFFHEGGHAMHFANTTNKTWEFQQLGNNAVTEGFAIFFENVWGEYEWLLKYRELVKNYNRFAAADKQVPVMTDKDMGLMMRNRIFWDLYMVRRYNGAKLIYETILHKGDPSIYKAVYSGQTEDPRPVYKDLFSDAYGFQLTDTDSLRFRTDVDSLFYSADYSRAFLLSAQLNETMRGQFGAEWFDNKGAGALLREKLWADGGKLQADEMAQLAGYKEVDYDKFMERMTRRLEVAERLIGKE